MKGKMMASLLHEVGVKRARAATVLARFSLGLCILYAYLVHYHQRQFLWGPDGVWPLEALIKSHGLSLHTLHSAPWFFELVFHAGIVVTALFTIGWRGRWTSPANFVFTWSIQERNPFLLDGGDNMLRIVLFYLLFADVANGAGAERRDEAAGATSSFGGMLHNLAVLAVVTQLCFMYFSTGVYKIMGEMWQNGTALYYVMRVQEFTWPGYSELVYRSAYLVVALTYATLVFEVSFPFLLVSRYSRWAAMAAGALFHGGIALFMGLVTFSWTMLSLYLFLITDREYAALAARVAQAGRPLAVLSGWLRARPPLGALQSMTSAPGRPTTAAPSDR